jgi:hypothetical protein
MNSFTKAPKSASSRGLGLFFLCGIENGMRLRVTSPILFCRRNRVEKLRGVRRLPCRSRVGHLHLVHLTFCSCGTVLASYYSMTVKGFHGAYQVPESGGATFGFPASTTGSLPGRMRSRRGPPEPMNPRLLRLWTSTLYGEMRRHGWASSNGGAGLRVQSRTKNGGGIGQEISGLR